MLQKQREGSTNEEQQEQLPQSCEILQQKLGIDLDGTALETKALQRKREIASVTDLLRLILFYGGLDQL